MTFDLRAQLLMDLGNWQKGLTRASKQMDGFGKSVKTIANGVKGAVAFMGVDALLSTVKDLAKAAADDNRSQALLNEQMKRTWHGNANLNKSIDGQIDKMSNLTGIADDNLRPALIRIAAVTKSPQKGMKYLGLATDIAAKSGKGLNMVSMNFAKYLGGNKTALDKLVPGLAKSGDRMKFLRDNYGGFAAIAGNNDPFGRINVIMDNFKEKLGNSFLPVIQKFADWLNSPEAQGMLDGLATKVQKFGEWFASPEGQKSFQGWMDDLKSMLILAGQFLDIVGQVASLLDTHKNQKAMLSDSNARMALNPMRGGLGYSSMNQQLASGTGPNMYAPEIHVYVDPIDGKISRMLKKEAQGKGIPLSKLLK